MQQNVGVSEFRRELRSFLDQVIKERQALILTRGSRPDAVLIPYEDFERYLQLQENIIMAKFDQVWSRLDEINASISEDEIENDIENAR